MTRRRLDLVNQAFNKLDRIQDGVITVEDLKGVYSAKEHPKYRSGEWNEDDVLKNFLNSFNGPDTDGIVRGSYTCRLGNAQILKHSELIGHFRFSFGSGHNLDRTVTL